MPIILNAEVTVNLMRDLHLFIITCYLTHLHRNSVTRARCLNKSDKLTNFRIPFPV